MDVFLVAQVRSLKGISALVQLFSSENQEVQRYATGATRNLIYENMDNKAALIEAGGISKLIGALREPDDELRKNITGMFMWVFSARTIFGLLTLFWKYKVTLLLAGSQV